MLAVFSRDFRAYFTSSIGYVYIGSYIFVLNLAFFMNNALQGNPSLGGMFSFVLTVMMFVTPILTMRVFSEEFKQKTDLLLFTAPVRCSSLVLGKYLSALAVFACLLALTLLWPLSISILGRNNIAEVIGNYIGIFALGSAYIAIGVFISSLTENQVIAAIGSLITFVALFLLETMAVLFYRSGVLPAFLVEVLSFISLFGRYTTITRGILALNDIVLFLSVSAVFIFLTIRRMDKRRWN